MNQIALFAYLDASVKLLQNDLLGTYRLLIVLFPARKKMSVTECEPLCTLGR